MPSLIYWLFFASGAAGLIYEIVWMRMLTRILGVTVLAYTIVLTTFMLGLAVGGWWFGRRIDRAGRPLRVYAALEAGIAVWALMLPAVLALATVVFSSAAPNLAGAPILIHVVRGTLAFGALLVPTILMGGTLPVLSKFLVERERELGHKVGSLYAVNTFGAIIGAGAAGFVLIGTIGESRTTLIAVALNLIAAGGALVMSRTRAATEQATRADTAAASSAEASAQTSGDMGLLVLLIAAITGATMLAYEVLWTRTAVLLLANTTYSFSLMLLAFLGGIAVGSAVAAACLRALQPSRAARWRVLAALQVLIGIVALVSLASVVPVVGMVLPIWMKAAGPIPEWIPGPVPAIFVLLAPLTLLSGASFPVAASLYVRDVARVGAGVGAVYLWNTAGAAAGSAIAGFLLLPQLGIMGSFLVCIGANIALGLIVFAAMPVGSAAARLRPAAAWAIVAAAVFAVVHFAHDGLDVPRTLLAKRLARPHQKCIFYREDINGIVSVWINPLQDDPWLNNKRLYIDAQPMASAYRYGMIYERLQAHYPLLLHPDPKDVLVICLGTGTTLGSVAQYSVETIDCVELSASVVAAGDQFREESHHVLDDPRLAVHIDDGRNYLLSTRKSYDVITAEPMHPHLAGTVNLYTREYFELVRSRLRAGGICSHWIPLNRMKPMEVKQAVQAFRAVFPHTVLFLQTAEAIVVGSDRPLTIDVERWRRLLGDARVSHDLAEVGLSGIAQLLSTYMVDDAGLRRYVGGVGPVTDDRPTLEFFGSYARAERGLAENIRQIVAERDPLQRLLEDRLRGELTAEERADLDRLYPLENEYLLAYADFTQGDWASAIERLQRVLEIAPEDKRAEITLKTLTGGIRVPGR